MIFLQIKEILYFIKMSLNHLTISKNIYTIVVKLDYKRELFIMEDKKMGLEALGEVSGGGMGVINKFNSLSSGRQFAIISSLLALTAGAGALAGKYVPKAYKWARGYDPEARFTIQGPGIDEETYGHLSKDEKKNYAYSKKAEKYFQLAKGDKTGYTYDQLVADGYSLEMPIKQENSK